MLLRALFKVSVKMLSQQFEGDSIFFPFCSARYLSAFPHRIKTKILTIEALPGGTCPGRAAANPPTLQLCELGQAHVSSGGGGE